MRFPRHLHIIALLGLLPFALPAPASAEDTLPFKARILPLEVPDGWFVEEIPGLEFNSKGHMFVFNRGQHALLEFDKKGKFIREIGHGLFKVPHGLRIDANDNIWTADQETHQVLRFNPEGKITMIIGRKGFPGTGWFERGYTVPLLKGPSDVAWDSEGNIYVADGENFRITKYNKHGEFLMAWGQKGDKPGEFNFPHSIVVDKADHLYVTDRENGRVQIFDTDGTFIKEWRGVGNPYIIQIVNDDTFWITDARAGKVMKFDREGKLLGSFGKWGKEIGEFGFPHGFGLTRDGKVYVGDLMNWRVQVLEAGGK